MKIIKQPKILSSRNSHTFVYRFSFLFTLCLLIQGSSLLLNAQCPSTYDGSVVISPSSPSTGQPITITVRDVWITSGCDDPYLSATLSGSRIDVTINRPEPPPGTICTTIFFTENRSYTSQNPIPAGTYNIYVDGCFELTFTIAEDSGENGLDCSNPINLNCGQVYNGNTNNGNTSNSRYSCVPYTYTAREKIHNFTLNSSSNVSIDLFNLNGIDLDVFLLARNSCNPNECIASSTRDQNQIPAEKIKTFLTAGTYTIVVEGANNSFTQGSYSLLVSCNSEGLICSNAQTITCGQSINGTTVGETNRMFEYANCSTNYFTGPEKIYRFTQTSTSTVDIDLTNLNGIDLDLFLFRESDCGTKQCIDSSTRRPGENENITRSLGAGSYYLVIDAEFPNTQGSYRLSLNGCIQQCDTPSSLILRESGHTYLRMEWDGLINDPDTESFEIRWREQGASSWNTETFSTLASGNEYNQIISGVENINNCYSLCTIFVPLEVGPTFPNLLIKGLKPCTDYQFQIRKQCGNAFSSYSNSSIFKTLECNNNYFEPTCFSLPLYDEAATIEHFQIDGKNFTEGNCTIANCVTSCINNNYGYKRNNNTGINLNAGKTYPFSIRLSPVHQSINEGYYRIWIDVNKDGDYDDNNERLFDSGNVRTGTFSNQIAIPNGITDGNTSMRIAFRGDAPPETCGVFCNGMVIDYDITLTGCNISADAGPTKEITCNNTSVSIGPNSAQTNLTYTWEGAGINNTNRNNPNPTVSQADTYTLTVTDANGCSATDNVIVELNNSTPTVDTGPTQIITCSRSSVTLGGPNQPNLSYSWTGPDNYSNETSSPLVSMPGNYNLTVTNTNTGCTASASIIIDTDTTNPIAEANATSTILTCENKEITLSANQGVNLNYSWTLEGSNFNSSSREQVVNQAGIYILKVTGSNGCSANTEITIEENKVKPMVNITPPSNEISCTNSSVEINAQTDADTYRWITPDGNTLEGLTQSINLPGTYTFEGTNTASGCVERQSIIVEGDANIPIANTGPSQTITCSISSVTIGSGNEESDLNYSWTGPGNFSSNKLIETIDLPGSYTLIVTNPSNNCQVSKTIEIVIDTLKPLAEIISNLTKVTCTEPQAILQASIQADNLAYRWSNQNNVLISNNSEAQVDAEGTYTLQITNTANSCSDQKSISIDEDKEKPIANAGLSSQIDCSSPEITLDGSESTSGANIEYNWTGPDINNSNNSDLNPVVSIPGNYTLNVTNLENGCSTADNVLIESAKDAPAANAGSNKNIGCQFTSVILDGSNSSSGPNIEYVWEGPNGFTSTLQSPEISTAGEYTLIVKNTGNNCVSSDMVEVIPLPEDININSSILESDCSVDNGSVILDISGGTAPYDIQWADAGNTNSSRSNLGAGTYEVTVSDFYNCQVNNSLIVENKGAPVIDLGTHDSYCNGETVNLDAGNLAGTKFNWSTGETTSSINVTESSSYVVTVTNSAGCEGIADVNITFLEEINPTYSLSSEEPICIGETISILIQDQADLTSNGSPKLLKQIELQPTKSEIITEVVANMCFESTIEIPIEVYDSLIRRLEDTTIVKGEIIEIEVTNGQNFNWSSVDNTVLSCEDCDNLIITTEDSIRVDYNIEDINGCIIQDSFFVNIAEKLTDIFPHINAITPNGDGKNDELYFPRLEGYPNNSLKIFNRWGDIVYQRVGYQKDEERWRGEKDGQELAAGVYYYVLVINDTDISIKSAITLIREKQ